MFRMRIQNLFPAEALTFPTTEVIKFPVTLFGPCLLGASALYSRSGEAGSGNRAAKTHLRWGAGQFRPSGGSGGGIDEVQSAVTRSQAPFSTSAPGFSKESLLESMPLSFHEIAALCTENEP